MLRFLKKIRSGLVSFFEFIIAVIIAVIATTTATVVTVIPTSAWPVIRPRSKIFPVFSGITCKFIPVATVIRTVLYKGPVIKFEFAFCNSSQF